MSVFIITFDKFNASFLNKNIIFLQNHTDPKQHCITLNMFIFFGSNNINYFNWYLRYNGHDIEKTLKIWIELLKLHTAFLNLA